MTEPVTEPEFKIRADKPVKVVIISISGEIRGLGGPDFRRAIFQEVQRHDANIVLDLKGLTYINSMGLSSILLVAKEHQQSRLKIAVCGLSKPIREVFVITGLDQVIPVLKSRSAALARITK